MPKKPNHSDLGETHHDDVRKECWEEDQKNRQYYYDDAHGYQTYQPDEEERAELKKKPGRKSRPGI